MSGISIYGILTFYSEDWRWVSIPFHSTIEAFGSIIALFLALLLLQKKAKKLTSHYLWVACGLIGMGILDLFHSMVMPGETFVWLHSTATFSGGLLFALVWLPDRFSRDRASQQLPIVVLIFSLALGVLSIAVPDIIPQMVHEGKFNPTADSLNILGGILFLSASLWFLVHYLRERSLEYLLFSSHCLLFGVSGLIFDFTQLWDAGWWFWHLIRLIAYSLGLYYVFTSYRQAEQDILDLNLTLEQRIVSRTLELTSERDLAKKYLDITGTIIVTLNNRGEVTLINKKGCAVIGYGPEEIIGNNWFELCIPERMRDQVTKVFHKIIAGEMRDVEYYENPILTKNGEERIIAWTNRIIIYESDKPEGILSSGEDITDRLRKEEELKMYTTKLARSNQELQSFAYIASHDLQEPLRKITAFGDRLWTKYADAIDDRGQDYLKRMCDAAERMQILINDLLSFSRVTTKAKPLVPVNLTEVVQEVIDDLAQRIEETNACIEVDPLPIVTAEPLHMRQLFQNLIGNALKFHDREKTPTIKIFSRPASEVQGEYGTVDAGDESWHIMVQDNGIGFDENHLDRIFEIFQRLHGRNAYQGSGIGLAICKKIVEYHNGAITARSSPGQGATFIVTLPHKNVP